MKIEEIILQTSARLRAIRKENKLTQREFADLFGISQSSYSAYENGSTIPTLEFLIKVAQKYKISMDYLTGLSVDRKGLQADEDNEFIKNTIFNPAVINATSEKDALLAYVDVLRNQLEETTNGIANITKIINEKYPEE